jgi:cobalt-zinc-cadmium efflux system protein
VAHHRIPIALAVGLNSAIVVVEAAAGLRANSLSLVMDSVHNLSDELALVLILAAYVASTGVSRHLLRSANLLNSIGLLCLSGLLLWQALVRLAEPEPVAGLVPVVVGLFAAAANWGVARLLREPSRDNAAVRMAYLHNKGDALMSLAPALAGLLILVSGHALFDALVTLCVGLWIAVTTMRELFASGEELIWPEKIVCGHADHGAAGPP